MSRDDLRRRAAVVREVALEAVLTFRGAVRDRHDKAKWHTEQGSLSVTGPKFMNWERDEGGGGAIDLVMHLAHVDFRTAVAWLEQNFGVCHLAMDQASTRCRASVKEPAVPEARNVSHSCRSCCDPASLKEPTVAEGYHTLRVPVRDDRMLDRVRQYLTRCRRLAAALLEPLLESGMWYADRRGNAVFLLVAGQAHRPVGAELRGTGPRVWRGMARGTRKDMGYFWIGAQGSQAIVLCESAIDAISYFQLHPDRIGISTSGVRSNPRWLSGLIACGYAIHCGFDADSAGDAAATEMITLHPEIQRLRPPAHDWNDALAFLQ